MEVIESEKNYCFVMLSVLHSSIVCKGYFPNSSQNLSTLIPDLKFLQRIMESIQKIALELINARLALLSP